MLSPNSSSSTIVAHYRAHRLYDFHELINADDFGGKRTIIKRHVNQNARVPLSLLQHLVLGNPHLNQIVGAQHSSKNIVRIVPDVLMISSPQVPTKFPGSPDLETFMDCARGRSDKSLTR